MKDIIEIVERLRFHSLETSLGRGYYFKSRESNVCLAAVRHGLCAGLDPYLYPPSTLLSLTCEHGSCIPYILLR